MADIDHEAAKEQAGAWAEWHGTNEQNLAACYLDLQAKLETEQEDSAMLRAQHSLLTATLEAERKIPRACRALEQDEVGAPCVYLQEAELTAKNEHDAGTRLYGKLKALMESYDNLHIRAEAAEAKLEAERKAREITADRAAENFSAAVEAGDRAEAAEQRLREVEADLERERLLHANARDAITMCPIHGMHGTESGCPQCAVNHAPENYTPDAAAPASPLVPGLERDAESIERRKAEWAALDAVIQTYSDDYEYGEDGYTPSRIELAICYDFLQGLIANDDFLAAIAQVYPVRSKATAEISRLNGEGSDHE